MSPAPPILPTPDLEPLQLLYVTNGLPLTADRWWQAHHYYQHRQNLHYQALHQPGIVCGLGVRMIPAPEALPSEVRDRRWIEIQPGIAIDLMGNPLVVDEPITFHIATEVFEQPVTVHVVLAYVDPRAKQWTGMPTDVVKEEFRLNERTTPPAPEEVELCRVRLTTNVDPLQDAFNVLNPAPQELDLRYRQRVQARSQHPVQVGLFSQQSSPLHDRLTALLQSVGGLYPPLAGPTTVTMVSLKQSRTPVAVHPQAELADPLSDISLLVLPYTEAISLTDVDKAHLKTYIAHGGSLLVEYADEQGNLHHLDQLQAVKAELQTALAELKQVESGSDLDRMRQDLMSEVIACEADLQERLHAIALPIRQLAQTHSANDSLSPSSAYLKSSGITSTPFLFDELPRLPTGPIHLMAWEGVMLSIGPLSAAWTSRQFETPLPRETLRSAQELGINILYSASRRQQLVKAQQSSER